MRTFAILLLAVLSAPALAGPLPDAALKTGGRACFGMTAEKGVTRLLLELHRELLNDTDPVTWGRVFAEVEGEAKPGYIYDGCGPVEGGSALYCSMACDGGSFYVESAGKGVRLWLGESGLRLRTCGSSLEEIGSFSLGKDRLPDGAVLEPVDGGQCRTAMEHIEKLLEAEEAGID